MKFDSETLKRIVVGMKGFELEDWEYVYQLPLDFDPRTQLTAIRKMLDRNQRAEQELTDEIRTEEQRAQDICGLWSQLLEDRCSDLYYDSAYQDATHSMAAVGLLAPFIESVAYQCFRGLEKRFFQNQTPQVRHARWQNSGNKLWDCHYSYTSGGNSQKNIATGILDLSKATGLDQHLPADIGIVTQALFGYRNSMFHNGMEWPKEERIQFQKRITDNLWSSDWFSIARWDSEPWVFYMTEKFININLDMADKLLKAFGILTKELFDKELAAGGNTP